ncbi:hypothetical protein GCM10009764_59840 [Nocardia ninae]|uniref:Uncharacterized protein n=1 Tax=Nocardia ninae NBRC 108245 TaxID=1210091 RepID=A0A511MKK2_9NOCA|nr:hypothetical protein NN4_54900 [Nocardia ninae NBRC 108245]
MAVATRMHNPITARHNGCQARQPGALERVLEIFVDNSRSQWSIRHGMRRSTRCQNDTGYESEGGNKSDHAHDARDRRRLADLSIDRTYP